MKNVCVLYGNIFLFHKDYIDQKQVIFGMITNIFDSLC